MNRASPSWQDIIPYTHTFIPSPQQIINNSKIALYHNFLHPYSSSYFQHFRVQHEFTPTYMAVHIFWKTNLNISGSPSHKITFTQVSIFFCEILEKSYAVVLILPEKFNNDLFTLIRFRNSYFEKMFKLNWIIDFFVGKKYWIDS